MKDLQKYFNFTLTDEQQELLEQLLHFIQSDGKVFILKGFAGTGKTSIIHGLVRYFGEKHQPFVLMASTGRAAKVLMEKARFPASTVHSSIYALDISELSGKNKDEEPAYRLSFKLKSPNYNKNVIYFIDESSMLTNHLQKGVSIAFGTGRLLDDLFKYVGGAKVVFIGDPAQLPPVNSKFSATLSKTYLQSTFDFQVEEFELTRVMRYKKNSGMYFNTNTLRKIIVSGRFPPLSLKVHDFDDMEVYYHENEMVKKYYETIKKLGIDSAVYITLSNKLAANVNRKVRNHLWGHDNLTLLKPGEVLMVARNNYLFGLNNGDLITVESVDEKIVEKAGLEFKKITIRVADPDPEKGIIIKQVLINTNLLTLDARDLSAEQDMELLKNYFARMRKIALEIYEILLAYGNTEERRKELNRKIKSNQINLNVDDILEKEPSKNALIRSIAYNNMQTDPFLNALRVKYGYAITCHKAQGSEWPHVFIHLEKSMFYLDKENQYRWVYTALSRAEKKIHILNNICLY